MEVLVYFYLILFASINVINCFNCGTDKIKKEIKSLKAIKMYKKNSPDLSNSNSFNPIKIGFDFTNFVQPSNLDSLIFSKLKSVLKEARD